MLERAIECFLSQTYQNTELVVLFESDPITEEYINCNDRYSFYELREEEHISPTYFLEPIQAESSSLTEGLKVAIKNEVGLVFANHGERHLFADQDALDQNVTIEKFQDNRFSLKVNKKWLNLREDGTIELTEIDESAYRYGYSQHLDGTFSLETASSAHHQDSLARIGWRKKIVREGKINNVVFCNIFPNRKMSLGMKRNLSIRAAQGEYICVWDDDDWYAPERIYNQMNFLQFTKKNACSLAYTILFDQNTGLAYYNAQRVTGHENSLLFKKEGAGAYGNLNVQEDTPLLLGFYNRNQLSVMEDPELYIYNYHRKNTSSSTHFKRVIKGSTLLSRSDAVKVKRILMAHEQSNLQPRV